MNDEQAFLNQILSDLKDDTARLVYADWLEERGDEVSAAKAEFLRVECAWSRLPEKKRPKSPLRDRLQKLARDIDTGWLAVLSKIVIENCNATFEFNCPKQWESMKPTPDLAVRYCEECKKNVYYCDSIRVARVHAEAGHCVAVDLGIIRLPGDLRMPSLGVRGKIRPEALRRIRRARAELDSVSEQRERRRGERST